MNIDQIEKWAEGALRVEQARPKGVYGATIGRKGKELHLSVSKFRELFGKPDRKEKCEFSDGTSGVFYYKDYNDIAYFCLMDIKEEEENGQK